MSEIFCVRLRELRKQSGLTQAVVAKTLNYGYTAISNYESGKNEPSLDNLATIAKYFNVCSDYLIGLSDDKYNYEDIKAQRKILESYCILPEEGKSMVDYIAYNLAKFYVSHSDKKL